MTAETPRAARAPSSSVLVESHAARCPAPGTGNTGRGLPVPGCHVTLTPGQLNTVLQALSDAEDYRWAWPAAGCDACDSARPRRCADHAADDDKAAEYASLARRLRKAAGHD